jgi:hypothetical protein
MLNLSSLLVHTNIFEEYKKVSLELFKSYKSDDGIMKKLLFNIYHKFVFCR